MSENSFKYSGVELTNARLVIDEKRIPTFRIGNEVCSFTFTLDLVEDRKAWAKIFGMKKGDATEFIFPKKKKRHSMRKKRRARKSEVRVLWEKD